MIRTVDDWKEISLARGDERVLAVQILGDLQCYQSWRGSSRREGYGDDIQQVANVILALVSLRAHAALFQQAIDSASAKPEAIGEREKALREAAEVAEANKLHWAGKVDPISAADPSRDIYRAKSAACFQVEMDILNLITATKEKVDG